MHSTSIGAAWKRRDRFKRGYLYVQIDDRGRKRILYLFPNPKKQAAHQPDYLVHLADENAQA